MSRRKVVVVGHGMVAHHLVTTLGERGACDRLELSVVAEEPRPAYDRVHLSSFFEGKSAEDLGLVEKGSYEKLGVELSLGDAVIGIERGEKRVLTASGRALA